MSDERCPKCGANMSNGFPTRMESVCWDCGSMLPGKLAAIHAGEFQQTDKCRIRELESQVATLREQRDRLAAAAEPMLPWRSLFAGQGEEGAWLELSEAVRAVKEEKT